MKQTIRRPARRGYTPTDYDKGNQLAARIILSDPARHARGCVALVQWGRTIRNEPEREQMCLFTEVA